LTSDSFFTLKDGVTSHELRVASLKKETIPFKTRNAKHATVSTTQHVILSSERTIFFKYGVKNA
jgi:hypothetical protein